MPYAYLVDEDGNILQVDGTNLVVKIGDGSDTVDIETIFTQLSTQEGLVTNSLMYGQRRGFSTARPVQLDTDDGSIPGSVVHLATVGLNYAFDGSNWRRLPGDTLTKSLINISQAHHEVHQGFAYSNFLYESIAGTSNLDLLIRVGASKTAHITFEASALSAAFLFLIENPTVTVQGVVQPEYNRNRDIGTDNANAVCYHTSTTAGGTTLLQKYIPAGNRSGSHSGDRNEWVLKQSEDYILRITNIGASANPASMQLSWYEI